MKYKNKKKEGRNFGANKKICNFAMYSRRMTLSAMAM